MTYSIVYRQEVKRIVQAVTIDNRVALGLAASDGNAIKVAVDAAVTLIGSAPLFYAIETDGGNLCGYFYLNSVGNAATLGKKNIRLQYSGSSAVFDTMIANFLESEEWKNDTLP